MYKRYIPLFWKFTIGIILAVLMFTIITIPIVWNSLSNSLERELKNRIIFIANSIAQKSSSNILYNQISELNNLVEESQKMDDEIAYIFILDSKNNVIAHSFDNGFPIELLKVNSLNNDSLNVVKIKSKDKNEYILDIATPVIEKNIGIVRVGLYEKQIQTDVNKIYKTLVIIIVLFLIISIFIAFLYSYLITVPIKFISEISQNINFDNIQSCFENKTKLEKSKSYKLRRLFFASDEIDILYNKFINMIERIAKTHEELQATHRNMLNAEKLSSIGVISSGIAHEINNPIIGLQNCIKRISHNPNNIKQNLKYFDLMNESIDNISKVANSLLNFSRKQEFKLLRMNIKIAIENSLQLAAYHLERNFISIKNNIPNEIPLIYGSRNHIEQVLLNLIINSVDAIVEKKKDNSKYYGEIIFNCKFDNKYMYLSINDNGIGIKQENLDNIFEPFFTTKEVGHGTGLGLSISQNIINEHNGKIIIESVYLKGTTITLILPVENIN